MLEQGDRLGAASLRWLDSFEKVTIRNGGGELGADGASVTFEFTLPAGYGEDREVVLRVEDSSGAAAGNPVFSPIAGLLTYGEPRIVRVSPDRNATMGNGWLRVIVQGINFCDGTEDCGEAIVGGSPVQRRGDLEAVGDTLSPRLMRWTDEEVEIELPDPQA